MAQETAVDTCTGDTKSATTTTLDARRYKCSDCTLAFVRTEHLVRHQLIHSGEKPYPCTVCTRGFSRLDALQRHHRIHNFKPGSAASSTDGTAAEQSVSESPSPTTSRRPSNTAALVLTRQHGVEQPVLETPPKSRRPRNTSNAASKAATPSKITPPVTPLPSSPESQPSSSAAVAAAAPIGSYRPIVRGSHVCPARLRELASSSVAVVANGDRALYHCPIKGCKTLLTSQHLSHHLEIRRQARNAQRTAVGEMRIEASLIIDIQQPSLEDCSNVGTRDLITLIDHIFNKHAMEQFCRACNREHTRGDYYSVENAPCIIPACRTDSASAISAATSAALDSYNVEFNKSSLQAVLAGNLPSVAQNSSSTTIDKRRSRRESEDSDDRSRKRIRSEDTTLATDSLLTLAHCATEELGRSGSITPPTATRFTNDPSPTTTQMEIFQPLQPQVHSWTELSDLNRFRIQDLLN